MDNAATFSFSNSNRKAVTALATLMLGACASSGGPGSKDYLMASGRWDNMVIVIDVDKALDPANDGTPNAVINRLRVTPTSTPTAPGNSTPWPVANRFQWSCHPTSAVRTSLTIPENPRRRRRQVFSMVGRAPTPCSI